MSSDIYECASRPLSDWATEGRQTLVVTWGCRAGGRQERRQEIFNWVKFLSIFCASVVLLSLGSLWFLQSAIGADTGSNPANAQTVNSQLPQPGS